MEHNDEFQHPWLAPAHGRALRACSRAQLDALAMAMHAALSEWSRAWGLDAHALDLTCSGFSAPSDAGAWYGLRNDAGMATAWLQVPPEPELLPHLVPGARFLGMLGQATCERCMADAIARIAAALELQWDGAIKGGPPAAEARRWTGALQVDITLPAAIGELRLDWRLVLAGEAVAAWCSRTAPLRKQRSPRAGRTLVSTTQALAGRRIALQVHLDGCELDLGALRALAAGDLVRLRHALAAPALLADGQGRTCLAGYLVNHAGHRALELARPEAPLVRTLT